MMGESISLFTRRTAIAAVGLTIVFVGLLFGEGRPLWGTPGFALWSAAWSSSTSQSFLDPYSLSHVLHGVILFWLLRPMAGRISLAGCLLLAIGLEIGWELLENSAWIIDRYRQDTAAFDYTGDSIINSLGDLLSAIVGFTVAARFSWKVSVALFVGLELLMLWMARDNLTLNIVMLLHPIEAIKQWQLAGIVPG